MIVAVEELRYSYPGGAQPVLEDVSFEIGEREVFGFLGPNGSGKSTTQKLLTRILRGYEGGIRVFGRDLEAQGPEYHEHMGVCFEIPNLYEKLTAVENLEFYRRFFGVECDEPAQLLEQLDLPPDDKRPVGQYSAAPPRRREPAQPERRRRQKPEAQGRCGGSGTSTGTSSERAAVKV